MALLKVIGFRKQPAFLAAEHLNLFGEEGLDVRFDHAESSAQQLGGLLSRTWDIAHTAADNAMLWSGSHSTRVFFVADAGLSHVLVAGDDIHTIAELADRSVGVDAVQSGYAIVLYGMLASAEVAPGRYRTVSLGGSGARLDALVARVIDGCLLGPRHQQAAVEAGLRVLARASDVYPTYPAATVVALNDWLERAPAQADAYTRALHAGAVWAYHPDNESAMVELLRADRGIGQAKAAAMYRDERAGKLPRPPSRSEAIRGLREVARLREAVRGQRVALDDFVALRQVN